jgi:hypothetical protein
MSIKLHKAGYDHAVALIKRGLEIEHDKGGNWNEAKATADEEVHYLNTHSLEEYGSWFLGIDSSRNDQGKAQYCCPFGNFGTLHVSALETIIRDAEKQKLADIKEAAQKLLTQIEQSRAKK